MRTLGRLAGSTCVAFVAALMLHSCIGGDPVRVLGSDRPLRTWAGRLPATADRDDTLRLLLLGHTYGDFDRRADSPGPAQTLVDSTEALAALRMDAVVLLGDSVYRFLPQHIDPTVAVLERLRAPVVATVGNHELGQGIASYADRFGGPSAAIEFGPALVLLVDCESSPWHLGATQIETLLACVDDSLDRGVTHVVVCIHKLVWALADPHWIDVLLCANANDGFDGTTDFAEFHDRLLERTQGRAEVAVCSGDVGRPGSVPLFVDRHPTSNVLFLATGLWESERDCAAMLVLEPGRPARVEPVPLGPQAPRTLREVDLQSTTAAP